MRIAISPWLILISPLVVLENQLSIINHFLNSFNMIKNIVYALSLGMVLTLLGCAFGRHVPYENMRVDLKKSGSTSVAVVVHDQREMVVDGSRKPDFVGYTRSAAGIAYPMGTTNGETFARVITSAIATSLEKNGFSVIKVYCTPTDDFDVVLDRLSQSHCDKLVLIKLNMLHSDFYAQTIFYSDVDINIFDKNSAFLFEKHFDQQRTIGGNAWGTGNYKEYCPAYLSELIEGWFNDPDVEGYL